MNFYVIRCYFVPRNWKLKNEQKWPQKHSSRQIISFLNHKKEKEIKYNSNRGYWFINEVFPTLRKQPNLQRQQEVHHQTKSKNTENKNKNQKKHIPTISKNNNLKQVPSLRVDRQVHFLLLSFFKFTEETKKWEILKFQRRKRRTMKMIRKAKAVIIWRWVGDLESS